MAKPQFARHLSQLTETTELAAQSQREVGEFGPVAFTIPAPDPGFARVFHSSRDPVLVVDAARWVVVRANAAACRLMGMRKAALIGVSILDVLRSEGATGVLASFLKARSQGTAELVDLRVIANEMQVSMTASLVKSGGKEYLLLHPQPAVEKPADEELISVIGEAIENAPMGFVVTDDRFQILYANWVFARMTGLVSSEGVVGTPMTAWIELSSADLSRLADQMASRESVSGLVTTLIGDGGASRLVHVLAVAVPSGDESRWGFTLTEHASFN